VSVDVLNNEILVGSYTIKAAGTRVDIPPADFVFVEVEQNLYVPSMAIIRLRHLDLASAYPTTFDLGKVVSVNMGQSDSDAVEIFKGEVVAQEIDASPTGIPFITIRAYDKRHRLMRGRKIKTFLDVSESDLVSQICSAAGLSGSATGAPTEVYKWVIQNNETDMEFLNRRARRLGMELVITDAAVKMQKPTLTVDSGVLTWGQDLLDLKVRLNTVNQVSSVKVRGWDPATKAAIVGESSAVDFKPAIGITKDGAALASDFGSSNVMYTVYRSVTTQADATLVATAIHNDLNGRAIQIQGRCFGSKSVKAGARVEIKGVGTSYNGKYYITAATHRFDIEGYITWFESNGKSTNNLLDLTNQDGERGGMMGPIIGIVTDVAVPDDAKKRGQLKVKYPVLGDTIVSDWMPLVQPMAGATQGFFFMPEVNDEMLVAFENGDISRPYALGAVWNGTDATPVAKAVYAGDDGKIKQRIIKTTSGHEVIFDDSPDARGITIKDKDGKNKIFIDSQNNKITIQSEGEMLLKAKTKMTIEAADLDITIENKITESAGEIATEAKKGDIVAKSTTGNIKFTATTNFEAKGTAGAKIAGATLDLKGDATAKLDGGGMTEIKGGLIKLN
jgi:phage protein D